jgi:hypothetical protein
MELVGQLGYMVCDSHPCAPEVTKETDRLTHMRK